jgi:Adenosine deaminase
MAALGVDPAPTHIDVDPPLLVRHLLDLGVVEIHQHIGAGMNFPLLWASALAALASPEVKEVDLESPGAPLSDGRFLVRWLLAAAIARCALAEYLIRGKKSFKEFLDELVKPDSHSAWTPRRRETLIATLEALISGEDKRLPDIETLRDLYADINPTALTLKEHPIEGVNDAFQRCDPIAVRLDLHGENAGERWFLRKGLEYLKEDEKKDDSHDKLFARIFWQIIRIRCQYYRAVVQRPLTGGLQWFIRFYDRLGNLRIPINSILPEASYHVAGEGHRIKALEFRTSIDNTTIEIGELVLDYLKSWQRVLEKNCGSTVEPEMGIVFHFVKGRHSKGMKFKNRAPAAFWADTYSEPQSSEKDVEPGRYVSYYVEQSRKIRALTELIVAVPSLLWVIRGLDVANDELGVPTWVLVPLFRHVLDASARVSILEGAGPPLKLTAHVGEDFRHLQEGLRRIYEQVHYVLDGNGGRLGHAIALGVDPQTWAESVGSIFMPAEERLWDLVWEWRMYSKHRIKPEYAAKVPAGRIDVLLNQVRGLSDHIYKHVYPIEELAEAYHLLHRFLVTPYALKTSADGAFDTFLSAARRIKTEVIPGHPVHSRYRVSKIIETYLKDESAFRRGQTLIDVPVRMDEIAALLALQNGLRCGISQRGIVVEVNPSSNLLIGDLLDLRNHPILRLFPPVPKPDDPPPVAIALGSDDPLTFSTQLLREYTLLHQAALAAGYSEREAQDWLETIRCTGMNARFTKAWKPSAKEKVKVLISDLSKYLQLPNQ